MRGITHPLQLSELGSLVAITPSSLIRQYPRQNSVARFIRIVVCATQCQYSRANVADMPERESRHRVGGIAEGVTDFERESCEMSIHCGWWGESIDLESTIDRQSTSSRSCRGARTADKSSTSIKPYFQIVSKSLEESSRAELTWPR